MIQTAKWSIKKNLTCQQDVVSQQNVIDELSGDVRRYV